MTKQELFNKFSINDSHNVWDNNIDNWMSVEVYRIMHNGNLPPDNDFSVKWVVDFLDKQNDNEWWMKNVMCREDWGSLYLTTKRMVYKFSEQLINVEQAKLELTPINNVGLEKVKLTKKALNEFISWTTSRYNDYLGYGTKKQNVNTIYNSLINGYFTNGNGKQDKTKTVFIIQCASPVGENTNGRSRGHHASNKYWETKQVGDDYTVDCLNKTITAKYSKRKIQFI